MIDTTEKLIQAVKEADSADKLQEAVENLAEAKQPSAILTLIEVLGYNNPGAAVAAVDGLIQLGEVVVPHLLERLDGYNYGARAWALRVFSGIGDPRSLDLLIDAATNDFSLSVRRAAALGLGKILWEKLPKDQVNAIQKEVLSVLLQVCQDPEWVVRYGAIAGLESLALAMEDQTRELSDILKEISQTDPEIVVRARAQLALKNKYLDINNEAS